MATPRKLTADEERLEAEHEEERVAVRPVGLAKDAITREEQRHADEMKRLEAEYEDKLVGAVVKLGAPRAGRILNRSIPKRIKEAAEARKAEAAERASKRKYPEPRASAPGDADAGAPDAGEVEGDPAEAAAE